MTEPAIVKARSSVSVFVMFPRILLRPLIEKGDLRIFPIETGINDLSSMNAHLGN